MSSVNSLNNYELALRVNDTSIKHISLKLKSNSIRQIINVVIRRLEGQGYTINELVWMRKNGRAIPFID